MSIDSPSRSACSTIRTASAPSGTGAPVMISTHSPGFTGRAGRHPGANFTDDAQAAGKIR